MQKHVFSHLIAIILMMALSFTACELGSSLFTDDEIGSMYTITFSQDLVPLSPGARLSPSKPLSTSVAGMDGAPEAKSLLLRLLQAQDEVLASITFTTAASTEEGVVTVKNFNSDIPPFTLPSDLADGYYLVEATLRDAGGATLSTNTTAILVYNASIPQPALAVYPGVVTPNEVSLLRLEGSFAEGTDPWIRWSIDGSMKAVGYASDLNDRLAWRAPKAKGVYLAKAEIFPFQPPIGHPVPPLSKVEVRLPLSSDAPALDPLHAIQLWSRLTFDGDFSLGGTMSGTANPVAVGRPYLETFPSGFGYLLGDGVGVQSSSSLLPILKETGLLAPFSLQLIIAQAPGQPLNGSGVLLSVAGINGGTGLVIGLEDGYPYIESGSSRTRSSLTIKTGVTRLALYVSPKGTASAVRFYIDEQDAGSGTLQADLFSSRPGACIVAGTGGYKAIYDELRVMEGAYPAFLISEQTSKGSTLLAASGFEGGHIDPGMNTSGSAILSDGSISLPSGSRLFFDTARLYSQGVSVSYELVSGSAALALDIDDTTRVLIDSKGTVSLGDARAGLSFAIPSDASRLTVSIESSKNGLRVYGTDGESVLIPLQVIEGSRLSLASIDETTVSLTRVSLSIINTRIDGSKQEKVLSRSESSVGLSSDESNDI